MTVFLREGKEYSMPVERCRLKDCEVAGREEGRGRIQLIDYESNCLESVAFWP